MKKKSLAIIGTGISGLGSAYFLNDLFEISLYDKNDYIGGHTNTVRVDEDGLDINIDTGFMVFNKVTYPNLLAFFHKLNIPYEATDMSFSVHDKATKTEWNGAGLEKLFSQRRNMFNPIFWQFLSEMKQFCSEAKTIINNPDYENYTIQEFIQNKNYGKAFTNWFLTPMGSAIWSTSTKKMMSFPIQTLLRFFDNHGFLGLDTHFQWYTVTGGSKNYIAKLRQELNAVFHLNDAVSTITKHENSVELKLESGKNKTYDYVILATHADEALQLLSNPSAFESELLSSFDYEENLAILHTDESIMPDRKRCWAAWNYRIDNSKHNEDKPTVHYWMNRLQRVSKKKNYFVSLNAKNNIQPDKILKEIQYTHPIFNLNAIQAQKTLSDINKQSEEQRLFYCGSYFKYGFHEDAFTSALHLSKHLKEII